MLFVAHKLLFDAPFSLFAFLHLARDWLQDASLDTNIDPSCVGHVKSAIPSTSLDIALASCSKFLDRVFMIHSSTVACYP